jgi:two-component system, OmpR family, sensor histidine kinase VicK
LYGDENTTNAILRLVSKSKAGIDIYGNYKMLPVVIRDELFTKALSDAKSRGVRLRLIIEINKDNIAYCKELMGIVELGHLDGLKGNFILNERDYISATSTLKEGKIIPQLIHTNIKEILEQQQYTFDTFWNNTTSAQEKIREVEEGLQVSNIDLIRDRKRAESLFISEVRCARSEVLIAVTSIRYLEYLAEIGLVDSIKQAKSKNVNIMILYSEDKRVDLTSIKLISDIERYAQIKSISGIQGSILIIDNSKVLTISGGREGGGEALTVYSDNKSLVNNFGSLLDALWSESEILDSIIVVKDNLAYSNKQLAEANEQLKNRDKMQQEFINIAAHELRTPIMPIIGYAEILEEELRDDDVKKSEAVTAIIRNAIRLQRISELILDITRIESQSLKLNKERFNLNDVITNVIDEMIVNREFKNEKSDDDNNNIKLEYRPKDIFVEADRVRVTQVISNLLDNSIKFTKEGKITITIEKKEDGEVVVISIKDTGIGIDSEMFPKLFSKFASKSYQGTGLGLFICKSIVEAHDGKIWAENNNQEKKGATFYFTLPTINRQQDVKVVDQ